MNSVQTRHVTQASELGRDILIETLAHQQARIIEFKSGKAPDMLITQSTASTLNLLQEKGVEEVMGAAPTSRWQHRRNAKILYNDCHA